MTTKVITVDKIASLRKDRSLVTTNGTFDILHVAHLRILEAAKKLGDSLLVLVNSDLSVKLNKGASRPIVPQAERIELLAGLACVDYILLFDDKEVIAVLAEIKPDIHVKGGTFIPERIQKEKQLVEANGGKFVTLNMIEGYSSTNIVEKIKASCLEN